MKWDEIIYLIIKWLMIKMIWLSYEYFLRYNFVNKKYKLILI